MALPLQYHNFIIRAWQPHDREAAAQVIAQVLAEYGLGWEPAGADQDVLDIETHYHQTGGEFWVIESEDEIIGTAAYYPISRGTQAVEIRKMYLVPGSRHQGLGKFLLQQLETRIQQRGFQEIWIETASVLKTAIHLYEKSGYHPATGIETPRCDRVYRKSLNPLV